MRDRGAQRKLAAIMFSDIVGYTTQMAASESQGLRLRERHRIVIGSMVARYRGEVVDENGDELVISFASASDAVNCALAAQAELHDDTELQLRIGIHLGDVVFEGGRIYGDGVNVASRIRPLAEPGGICVSESVYESVKNQVNVSSTSLGEKQIKNVARPMEIFAVSGTAAAPQPELASGRPGAAKQWHRMQVALAIVAVVLAAIALATWATWPRPLGLVLDFGGFGLPPAEPPLPDRPSIAVLPFVNMSGDPAQDYFSDGITEDLITDLARIPEIFVIARGSSFTYKGTTPDPKVVGRELGVRYVVEGSVRRSADRVRITARLTDATQRHQLWSERYDRKLEDLFSLQSEISLKILGEVKLGLRDAELRRLLQRPERDLRAHDAVLRGFAQIERQTRAGLHEGRRLFAHATELDPSYAEAWAFLGMTYAIEYTAVWDRKPTIIDRARELGSRALELNPNLPAAWALLATTELWGGHADAAVAAAQRAVELAPSLDSPYHFLGLALAADGRFLAALDQIQTAMRINPRSPHSYKVLLSFVNWRVGRLDEALVLWEDLRRANPDLVLPRIGLATAYENRGAHAEAQRVVAEILRVNPELTAKVAATAIPARLSASQVAGIEATLLRAGLP